MKNNFIVSILFALSIISCKTDSKTVADTNSPKLPSYITKVMNTHGGYDQWHQMKQMSYNINRGEQNETQQIDLQSRKERIDAPDFNTGFDGEKIWLKADTSYSGNAEFYHNLMFYFIAMPFVLSDEGIFYKEVIPFSFGGVKYHGVEISYGDGIGMSPEDNYYLYYHPETHRMEWLAYTVTYFSKEKSKNIRWIRYDDWSGVNGLLLPNSLEWYKHENGLPSEPRNRVKLSDMHISKESFDHSIFQKIEGAEFIN